MARVSRSRVRQTQAIGTGHGRYTVFAKVGERQTEVEVEGPRPSEFVGTIWTGEPDDRLLLYLTADPEQLLAVRLLWPDFTRIDGYVYLHRADLPRERLEQIDRLVAAKRQRKRGQN